MSEEPVLYEVSDRIAILTLNRPDRLNAYTALLGHHYFSYLERADRDPDVNTIIVTGAGRGFCAGADMDLLQGISSGLGNQHELRHEHQTWALGLRKPLIAAVNGACAGLGFVMAAMADIRFSTPTAKFTTAFARRGLIAEHGIGWVLPKLVGPSRALDILMSGRVFLGDEAHELGFVNHLAEPDELMGAARAYANDIATNVSPKSIEVMKRQVWHGYELAMTESNEIADTEMTASLRRPDFTEGVQSFLQRRSPEFDQLAPRSD